MATITGTDKFFNTPKGYGFISPENGEKDAFVHISAVQRSGLQGLYEGDKVTYELETGRDAKVSATNLTLLPSASAMRFPKGPTGPFLLAFAQAGRCGSTPGWRAWQSRRRN